MSPRGKARPCSQTTKRARGDSSRHLYILGRGGVGVKARQFNALALAFCHPLWLPTSVLKASHLQVLRRFRA
ncbi:hypothetical protein SBA1_500024 [Candidatus Sulfotelmatobacter kueseliae]|uniref:Uncharacterized protein n=1 Tax=Candidatus Sulfotelmatobacter kueseliae TaxID=2042962 RepID=A0A2U3KW68_9BACT|nr:hypothetical protein SBA1_500024 [Candidatus Sulfotelmatobacter kueseliae]